MKKPLAAQIRPQTLDEFIGQSHIVGAGKFLRRAIESGHPHSMVLWGPPGTGKTTLAQLVAKTANAQFIQLSAVTSGVKDIREAIKQAQKYTGQTVLFIDEVHRFNKAQQDGFLPVIEDGTIIFIGATTENPSFELNNALLSRLKTYVLKSLAEDELSQVLDRALKVLDLQCPDELLNPLIQSADGDARQLLNTIELISQAKDYSQDNTIDKETLEKILSGPLLRFDKGGDHFYDQISALHKSVRGSNPDGALYWLSRMLLGGADPIYIARRVVRMASEDIGNADPRALEIALNAWDVQQRLGSPEGEIALAQAVSYMAVAAKSNAVYKAFNAAWADAKNSGSLPVPIHLRNAPTKLMKNLGFGKEYRYDHDEDGAHAKGQQYFPDKMGEKIYYQPAGRGLEIKIKEKLEKIRD